ncbi:uncharacterized protein ColSpa_11584 [Colletotrichum spaethianum]|uniref:Uncharacterized protein n=1 Tax=Colletotrichum spaethianum TaxID=700344 RepID=A0AA37PFT9_9PEZI|nr:uncharacterized protein ColSpa_11584 [Colletotrichum spaethianum]GKT51403.1 hypothetical protein ColSpa_11584 [Colletotrichum spaethianum]
MASRYPMPNIYNRPTKEKTDSSPSTSGAIKSFFTIPQAYPVVSASTSKYPLPPMYTSSRKTAKSAPPASRQHDGQGVTSSRASVESWDTVDQIKEDHTRV